LILVELFKSLPYISTPAGFGQMKDIEVPVSSDLRRHRIMLVIEWYGGLVGLNTSSQWRITVRLLYISWKEKFIQL
jgi:hypothetical protein